MAMHTATTSPLHSSWLQAITPALMWVQQRAYRHGLTSAESWNLFLMIVASLLRAKFCCVVVHNVQLHWICTIDHDARNVLRATGQQLILIVCATQAE